MIAVAPPSFRRERALIKRGVWPVAGCDEAGRGPLAGPVVAAAVVLDPKRIPKGHRRFQAADRRAPRGTVRGDLRDVVLCGRLCLAGADRSRQYPARLALGAGARRARAARNAEACVRRRPRQDRRALRLRRGDRRRRHRDVDRGGLDHRQGDARPPDVRAGAGLPGLRLRDPQGLCRAGTSRGAGPARAERPPPPLLRARDCGAAKAFPETVDDRSNPISFDGRTARSTSGDFRRGSAKRRLPRRLVRSIKRLGTDRAGSARAFRTFHALHLAGCRTDPRPAAAGGLARGAAAGRHFG